MSRSTYPSICNSFPVIRTTSAKNTRFRVPQPTFLFSSRDVPATTTLYFPWMKRELDGCQTPRTMYLSILNTFRVIRCLSKCVSTKIAIFIIFLFPWGGGTPLGGNHVKCYMDGKRIRMDGHRLSAPMHTHCVVIERNALCPRQLRVWGAAVVL